MNRVKLALTRKLGPLPAFAWLLIAGAGILAWRLHSKGTASTSLATGTASGAAAGAGTGAYGAGDAGGGSSGSTTPPSPELSAPASWDPVQITAPVDVAAPVDNSPAPAAAVPVAAPAGHLTQTLKPAGAFTPLVWGGKTFTTQAAFQTWAKQHGSTVRAELAQHPQASEIYSQLHGGGTPPAAAVHKPAKPAPDAVGTRSRNPGTAPAPARPPVRPVSVRNAAPRSQSTHAPSSASSSRTQIQANPTQRGQVVRKPAPDSVGVPVPHAPVKPAAPAPHPSAPVPAVRPPEQRTTKPAPATVPAPAPKRTTFKAE